MKKIEQRCLDTSLSSFHSYLLVQFTSSRSTFRLKNVLHASHALAPQIVHEIGCRCLESFDDDDDDNRINE